MKLISSALLYLSVSCVFGGLGSSQLWAVEPDILLDESFATELSDDWFWGLGTWTAKDGILRGFESGPRRYGP